MFKLYVSGILVLLLVTLSTAKDPYTGFTVKGRYLYDKTGEKVILRGINKMIIWRDKDGSKTYPEIAKTGANVVRIVWTTTGSAKELEIAITNCINNKMIPMIELHDATGKWKMLEPVVDYWTSYDIKTVIQKHQEYLLVNIANECGEVTVPNILFRNEYTKAINRMRDAKILVPLIIDATDWGKKIDILQEEGPALIEADPEHNLMFSIHMWWPALWGYDEKRIIDELNESVAMDLPLIVGEFGNKWDETPEGAIPYLTILKQCQLLEIGWLAWSWGPGNHPQSFLDMTQDGTFDTLHDWGLEVAITDSFSIKNTSKRPQFILNGDYKQNDRSKDFH